MQPCTLCTIGLPLLWHYKVHLRVPRAWGTLVSWFPGAVESHHCYGTSGCTTVGSARDHFAHLLFVPPGGLLASWLLLQCCTMLLQEVCPTCCNSNSVALMSLPCLRTRRVTMSEGLVHTRCNSVSVTPLGLPCLCTCPTTRTACLLA